MNDDRIPNTCGGMSTYAGVIFVCKRLYYTHKNLKSICVYNRCFDTELNIEKGIPSHQSDN